MGLFFSTTELHGFPISSSSVTGIEPAALYFQVYVITHLLSDAHYLFYMYEDFYQRFLQSFLMLFKSNKPQVIWSLSTAIFATPHCSKSRLRDLNSR